MHAGTRSEKIETVKNQNEDEMIKKQDVEHERIDNSQHGGKNQVKL